MKYVEIGWLCQNDETGEGPTKRHRLICTGYAWSRDRVMSRENYDGRCPDCYPVFRALVEEPNQPSPDLAAFLDERNTKYTRDLGEPPQPEEYVPTDVEVTIHPPRGEL